MRPTPGRGRRTTAGGARAAANFRRCASGLLREIKHLSERRRWHVACGAGCPESLRFEVDPDRDERTVIRGPLRFRLVDTGSAIRRVHAMLNRKGTSGWAGPTAVGRAAATWAPPTSMPPPLHATRCPQQRREALRRALAAAGFDDVALFSAECIDAKILPRTTSGDALDAPWRQVYLRERHHRVDPRLKEAAASGLPVAWCLDQLRDAVARDLPCEHAHRFVADLRSTGMGSGVVLVLRDGPGGRTLIDLHSRREGREWITDAVLCQAAVLAMYARELCLEALARDGGAHQPGPISDLQQSILRCVHQGMGDKVIAARLGLSRHNLDYHMRRLRERFGARNRVQLVQATRAPG